MEFELSSVNKSPIPSATQATGSYNFNYHHMQEPIIVSKSKYVFTIAWAPVTVNRINGYQKISLKDNFRVA